MDWNLLTKDVARDIELAKKFEKTEIDIVFEHVKAGAVYPKGTNLKVNLAIKSKQNVSKVGLVLNGEYLGVKNSPPYLWGAETEASFKNMNTGVYNLKAHVTDVSGTRVEKIITITIK